MTDGLSHSLNGLSYDSTYWWQVKAINAAGETFANAGVWWRFTTESNTSLGLGSFSKTLPIDQRIGVLVTGTLVWNTSANAARYTVCLGSEPGLCDVMSHAAVLSPTTSMPLSNTAPGRTYWWQVFARSDGAFILADAGRWWAFTTANDESGPGEFGKIAPLSGAEVGSSVLLQWQASTGAEGYRVCVGTDWGLCDIVNNAPTGALTYALAGLQPGSYWWQITAVDSGGDTTQADGGERWKFHVLDDGIGNLDNPDTRKEAASGEVRMGERVAYTIVLSNSGGISVTARVTDTLVVSATLLSATPGYIQNGQTLVWSNLVVPPTGTIVLTMTVSAGSGPLPGGYTLANSAMIGAHDAEIARDAPEVQVGPWRAYLSVVFTP